MTDPRVSRRQVLAGGIGGAAAVGLAALGGLQSSGADTVRRASKVQAAGTDLGAVEHVVFLMQENRSFDHYFGTMQGSRLRRPPATATSGSSPRPGPAGATARCCPSTSTPRRGIGRVHRRPRPQLARPSTSSWNNGAMDSLRVARTCSPRSRGPEHGVLTMGYYRQADIPFYYDAGRHLHHLRQLPLLGAGPDAPEPPDGAVGHRSIPTGWPAARCSSPTRAPRTPFSVHWDTMPEVLEDAGVSWKVYNPYGPHLRTESPATASMC